MPLGKLEADKPVGIPLTSLRRYLTLTGWRSRPLADVRAELFYFDGSGLPKIEMLVPKTRDMPDYNAWIGMSLRTLSQFEGRDSEDVLFDLNNVLLDIIRSSLPDSIILNDTIPLPIASHFVSGFRKLLANAATAELSPGRHFGRVKKDGISYAETCRFGHTFRGSFGFTIESPVTQNQNPTFPGVEEQSRPFPRRVFERIARGLRDLENATAQDNPKLVADRFPTGFNANMCDEFADMLDINLGGPLRMEISLSKEWQAPPDIKQTLIFGLDAKHVIIARAAAADLRQPEMSTPQHLVGRVISLKSSGNPSDLENPIGDREVIIDWPTSPFGEVKVGVVLAPDNYLLAIDAHKGGQLVSVNGLLDKPGRQWKLREPTNFAVKS